MKKQLKIENSNKILKNLAKELFVHNLKKHFSFLPTILF